MLPRLHLQVLVMHATKLATRPLLQHGLHFLRALLAALSILQMVMMVMVSSPVTVKILPTHLGGMAGNGAA